MVQKKRERDKDQWLIGAVILLSLLNGAFSVYNIVTLRSNSRSVVPTTSENPTPVRKAVTGLGRLEPQGEVIRLSPPTSAQGARVSQVLVQEGDRVAQGQIIAVLDTYEPRLAALNAANQQVKIAKAQLARVQAGAQTGQIEAQQATIARLQAELQGEIPAQQATIARLQAEFNNAQAEYQRYQDLYQEGAISASLFDSKRLPVATVQQQLNEARATLNRTISSYREQISQAKATLAATAEVRPVDVQVAQSEVDGAIAAVTQAQADLNLSYVRAPKDTQVLKVHTRPGELVSNRGIAELGQTNQMYAIAEIYETDINKVNLGQKATITSSALSEDLSGKVTQIGLQVNSQEVLSTNPTANTDNRVVEVRIRIDNPEDNQRVAGLTNLQVQVAINI
ncbi:ABC exporter membrane fusion protein [Gloeocapsopsis crepidinum LEGE 06123]|uniref:ABC exporter membrane fusion protein n=1 Tax=Gloeocapsopsis crepidinum LEGE 06123 TaxID=588587 RepID=A0ABR9UQU9_9CHRO|nr:ABC exporter membrane fusion protein [Gloeocapsopsis crepidinum]MBE9189728.1 ABC exporter membrane fusion protein [Gloeocapsopsis crepidinum LEGE 06123]